MIGNVPFKFDLLRKYTVAFGTLFSNIMIVRQGPTKSGNHFATSVDDEGVNVEMIKVPLTYSSKDKLLARVDSDPNIERPDAITLPRIAFDLRSIDYDVTRKVGSIRNGTVGTDISKGIRKKQLTPVPYILSYTVWVATKYQEEGNQILEQILPFFEPHFPMTMTVIPEMNVVIDTPVALKSVTRDDTYKGQYSDRREIIWALEFEMVAYFYGPIRKQPVIKFVEIDLVDATAVDDITQFYGKAPIVDKITLQPGLTANGQPTTDPAQSIDYHLVNIKDDWGYAFGIAGDAQFPEGTGGNPDDKI